MFHNFFKYFLMAIMCSDLFMAPNFYSQPAQPDDHSDGCTSITVGRLATSDGSVINSHTCDSHRTRTWFDIVPVRDYSKGTWVTMRKRVNYDSLAMPAYQHISVGKIPQVSHTHGYINTAYPCMNDHQLAVGESTFEGRKTLHSDSGLIDCQQLVKLMIERCATAREAIRLADTLITSYGWSDEGECLTIADKKEVWHLEIVGPGKGNLGGIWAARRVPDDHIAVNANGSRIRQINFDNPDYFMASKNVSQVAQDSGWWNTKNGPFEFCYAYDPEGRQSMSVRRREWRVLDLAAPSLGLHPESENYPFSVKPDTLITLKKMIRMFQDYFEGTDYNFVKNLTVTDDSGRTVLSPFANPFMPYEMNKLFKIKGGWGWRGERPIARWYTIYATITQSRDWLPDPIGGVVWLAWDNTATSIYIPIYSCTKDVPDSYKTPGRVNGYTRESAWWAFNRMSTIAAQRWGNMRKDVEAVWKPLQKELLENQKNIEKRAMILYKHDPKEVSNYLTEYTLNWGEKVVKKCWQLGDFLWTKYDEKF